MAGKFCGHSDPPVNARGRLQIAELVSKIAAEPISAVYTSDLRRAITTAKALARPLAQDPIVRQGLREIAFGEWEGLAWQEIENRDPVYASKWMANYPNHSAPQGESFDAFRSRVLVEIDNILSCSRDSQAAVVTHAGVMRVVLQSLCGLDERDAWRRTEIYCSFFKYPCEAGR
ncbi:alpha-ribazole phosphatase/probable phosphoglycerate mutase [Silvibacterium bohemicum]|uniref:Alpha-ribazole phosphatase/probable phosphoglycerate mutase n=2 Tax=Silvibacterium bohemicum TaxID=1577686 RepID=A0A841JT47_9BACT|nr:alpha-ribazole phosphatase/probable phosphoglycerate mutase [Silvibacterium bohemicum]